MKKQAKKYSAEEKAKGVMKILSEELAIAQITSKYGVHTNQTYKGKKEALESIVTAFKSKSKKPHTSPEELTRKVADDISLCRVT